MWLLAALPWLLVLDLEPTLGGARRARGLYVSEATLLAGFLAAAWGDASDSIGSGGRSLRLQRGSSWRRFRSPYQPVRSCC